MSTIAIVKQLLAEGIIADEDYLMLIPNLADRNAVAHGFIQQHPSDELLSNLRAIASRLIERLREEELEPAKG